MSKEGLLQPQTYPLREENKNQGMQCLRIGRGACGWLKISEMFLSSESTMEQGGSSLGTVNSFSFIF